MRKSDHGLIKISNIVILFLLHFFLLVSCPKLFEFSLILICSREHEEVLRRESNGNIERRHKEEFIAWFEKEV